MLHLQNCSMGHSICHRITVAGRLVRTTHTSTSLKTEMSDSKTNTDPSKLKTMPKHVSQSRWKHQVLWFGHHMRQKTKQLKSPRPALSLVQLSDVSGQQRQNSLFKKQNKKNTCYVVSTGNSYQTGLSESSRPRSELSWVIHTDDDSIWLRLKLVTKLATPHVERNLSVRTYAYFISLSGRQPWKILR